MKTALYRPAMMIYPAASVLAPCDRRPSRDPYLPSVSRLHKGGQETTFARLLSALK